MNATSSGPLSSRNSVAWYREVSGDQWRCFFAAFLGWLMDAFDFSIMTFVLIDIQKSFAVDRALAGLLGTVTLAMRLIGASVSGSMADKWGRKLPLMLSVLWFSLFAFLSGFSTSYAMLFALRALFGIGMGGEWAAAMPLVIETWPSKLRGLVSGLVQGGWYWGTLLSAVVFQFVYPIFSAESDVAWRTMFWIAIIPALMTLWIRSGVKESPVWLERQRMLAERERSGLPPPPSFSLSRIFQPDLRKSTFHAILVMACLLCAYSSITFWYATFLRQQHLPTLPYFAAFNIGSIFGNAMWGRISETRIGRRGALCLAMLIAVADIPIYLHGSPTVLLAGAAIMGMTGTGGWGVIPAYLSERFPTSARGAGPGFVYHAGAVFGAMIPLLLGTMQDRGTSIPAAMTSSILVTCLLTGASVWMSPETRGKTLLSTEA